jgi:putative ABC transport system ATP-binding protein
MNEIERPIIEVRNLRKTFENGRIPALNGASLAVFPGEFIAIMGPSGCGKSTLLHLVAALDRPDGGEILIDGRNLADLRDLSRYRGREVGVVFQLHNLLPSLTASENVQVPMFETGHPRRERRERARRLLALVGLNGKEDQRPTELSGGERQRVAIARALANDPPMLLADEPTGSLDSVAGQRILDLLEDLRAQRRLTILLVTHDQTVAARADRIARMLDGRVVDEGCSPRARDRFAGEPWREPAPGDDAVAARSR